MTIVDTPGRSGVGKTRSKARPGPGRASFHEQALGEGIDPRFAVPALGRLDDIEPPADAVIGLAGKARGPLVVLGTVGLDELLVGGIIDREVVAHARIDADRAAGPTAAARVSSCSTGPNWVLVLLRPTWPDCLRKVTASLPVTMTAMPSASDFAILSTITESNTGIQLPWVSATRRHHAGADD
jgi:hypothetical protein